jgi:dGTPase
MRFGRLDMELRERQLLAPYGKYSGDSRGRAYSEMESAYRTAFQRDRDRIIHSAAFRRLEYKTQVFVNDEGDYYRTRLTHTLEVAQIGRTIARALGANEDLVEAICLAHDLGHPPFGHSGEDTLNRLMVGYGGFNHNLQSYRVVTELETRYQDWKGLNLTHETLDGISNHRSTIDVSRVVGNDPQHQRGSLEAQIADLTDELAYSAHDVDDGLQAGLIDARDLERLEIWDVVCDRLKWGGGEIDDMARHRVVRELVGLLVDDVLTATEERLNVLTPNSGSEIETCSYDVVGYSVKMNAMQQALRQFLYEEMYYHHRVVRMARRAERFLNEIFATLVGDPRQLPKETQSEVERVGLMRAVADYVASMTDRSAMLEYRRLFDPLMKP